MILSVNRAVWNIIIYCYGKISLTIPFKLKFSVLSFKAIVLLLFLFGSFQTSFSQVACGDCHSNDFDFQEFYIGDATGAELTTPCTAGTPVTAYLWLKVISNSTRYSLSVAYDLTATNSFTGVSKTTSVNDCLYEKKAIPNALINLGTITWNCGEVLKITNFQMSWQQNISSGCAFGGPKCSCVPLAIVRTPLSVDFNYNTCNNGTNTTVNFQSLTTGGSTGIYSYLWTFSDGTTSTLANPVRIFSNAAAPFSATLKVIDGAVQSTITKIVVANSALSLQATPMQIACSGGFGSVSLVAAGGTAPYTYSGSPTSNLTAGTYNYTVTDANGCIATASAVINAGPPTLTLTETHTAITCFPGSSTITATGGGGTGSFQYKLDNGIYQGSNVFNAVSSGAHMLYIKDSNNCEKSIPVNITAFTVLNSNASMDICTGVSYDITKSISNYRPDLYTYVITDPLGNIVNAPYQVSTAGNYQVKVYQSPGCQLQNQTIQLIVHPKPGSPIVKIN